MNKSFSIRLLEWDKQTRTILLKWLVMCVVSERVSMKDDHSKQWPFDSVNGGSLKCQSTK